MIQFSVRGALNSIYDPSNNVGLISSFFLANYWSSVDQAKMTLIMPVIFICLMFLFPESPEYLHSKNMEKVRCMCFKHFVLFNMVSNCDSACNIFKSMPIKRWNLKKNNKINKKIDAPIKLQKATKSRRFYKGIKVFDTDEMTQTTLERGHIEEVKPKYVDNNVETETKLELRDFCKSYATFFLLKCSSTNIIIDFYLQ